MDWQRAAEEGNQAELWRLVNACGDVDSIVADGATPLHFAAQCGHDKSVQFILGKTNKVEAHDKFGRTPLYLAVFHRHAEVTRLLLQREVDPNAGCKCGTTAVSKAAENGDVDILEQLLKRGASWNTQNLDGESPKDLADRNGHAAASKLFVEFQTENLKSFLTAARRGSITDMKYLINSGIDPEARNTSGASALDMAAQYGQLETVRFLINDTTISKLPQDQRARTADAKKGITALHWASRGGHESVVRLLLKAGADPNASEKGILYTPLHRAAQAGHDKVVELLLDWKAEPNARAGNDVTPLHLAATQGREAVVRLLLDQSRNPAADPLAKDGERNTAKMRAIKAKRKNLEELLEPY